MHRSGVTLARFPFAICDGVLGCDTILLRGCCILSGLGTNVLLICFANEVVHALVVAWQKPLGGGAAEPRGIL